MDILTPHSSILHVYLVRLYLCLSISYMYLCTWCVCLCVLSDVTTLLQGDLREFTQGPVRPVVLGACAGQ